MKRAEPRTARGGGGASRGHGGGSRRITDHHATEDHRRLATQLEMAFEQIASVFWSDEDGGCAHGVTRVQDQLSDLSESCRRVS